MAEAVGREAGALVDLEGEEDAAAGASEELEVGVPNDHAAEVEGLEAVEGVRHLLDPRRDVAAPVLGDEVEHGRPRLPLELE